MLTASTESAKKSKTEKGAGKATGKQKEKSSTKPVKKTPSRKPTAEKAQSKSHPKLIDESDNNEVVNFLTVVRNVNTNSFLISNDRSFVGH